MESSDTEQIFAVIVPSEASLTAPIAAGVELSKLFILSSKKVEQLQQQTRVIPGETADGEPTVTIVDHPDLKWWFDQTRKLATDVAKITANIQAKDMETNIKLAEMFLHSDILTKEQQEEIIKAQIVKKMEKTHVY